MVVEKDEGPRMVFRYDPFPEREEGRLFTALAPKDFAKLFCAKRALRGGLVELQLEDVLFVSCPAGEVGERDAPETEVFWGDGDGVSEEACAPVSRLKFFALHGPSFFSVW